MVDLGKCPKCGHQAWKASGNDWVCGACGYKMPKKDEPETKEKVKIPLTAWPIIILVIELAVFAALYLYSPVPKIMDVIVGYLLKYVPENYIALFSNIFWIVLGMATALIIGLRIVQVDFGRLFKNLATLFFVVDVFVAGSVAIWYVVANSGSFDSYLCLSSNFFTLGQISPEIEQRCVQYQKSQLPASTKEGTATPLDVSFGYPSQGEQPYIPNVYTGMPYSLPVTIKNVDKETVTGVVVKGYVKNDSCAVGVDCVDLKAQFTCSDANPCDIPAGQSLQITLQSDTPVAERPNTFVDFDIQVSYPETGYGTGDLYFVRSLQDLQTLTKSEPQTKTGPLDVVIYFAPDFYLATSNPANQINTANEIMFVAVANNGKGIGKLSNILIYKIGTYENLQNVQCPIPWQKDQTIAEGTQFNLQGITIPKTANIQFTCTINIDSSTVNSILNNLQSPFSTVVYASSVNYEYFETYALEGQRVFKLG